MVSLLCPAPVAAVIFESYRLEIAPSDSLSREIITFTILNDQEEALYDGNYSTTALVQNVRVMDYRVLQYS